jgi:hypothetical protein
MPKTVIAYLNSTPEVLQVLREAFDTPNLYLGTAERGEALVFPLDTSTQDTLAGWNEAKAITRLALGALNVFANMGGEVEIGPVSVVDESGTGQTSHTLMHLNVRVMSPEGRAKLLERGMAGNVTTLLRIVKIARARSDIARSLAILENRDPSWADIYLLMEIVEIDLRVKVGHSGRDWYAIKAQNWLAEALITALKRNAGYHRHAKQFVAPDPPMQLHDAQRHCKLVVRRWLESLTTA